jgi:hypothetical protein
MNGRCIKPFAAGGVIGTPTYFPLSSGGLGLAGEAGPEAIVPLTRGPDGRLGVAMAGMGAPANVAVQIATPDAGSFRRSEAYITGDRARGIKNELMKSLARRRRGQTWDRYLSKWPVLIAAHHIGCMPGTGTPMRPPPRSLFPLDIALKSAGGPERRTEIVALGSGREERNARWAHSRRRYDAGYGVKTLEALSTVVAFFEERRGLLHGFRWRDRLDHSSATVGAVVSTTTVRGVPNSGETLPAASLAHGYNV